MEFIGKNKDFKAIWDCSKQMYSVFYKNRFMTVGYKFSNIKTYLN